MSMKLRFCGHYNFTMYTFNHFMDSIFFKVEYYRCDKFCLKIQFKFIDILILSEWLKNIQEFHDIYLHVERCPKYFRDLCNRKRTFECSFYPC